MDITQRPVRILHLSDTHIAAAGTLMYGRVDTRCALDRVLAHADPLDVELVAVTGDLSDDGSEESYLHLRGAIGSWADRHDAPIAWTMGNHDLSAPFEAALGPREHVFDVCGHSIVVADSTVPGRGYGDLDDAALDRLRDRLADASGAVLLLHHPPVPAATTLLATLQLQNPDALLAACRDTDLRVILAGHYHLPMASSLGSTPVVVAPAVANRSDVTAGRRRERAHAGSGYAVVDVPATGPVRTVFVDVPRPGGATLGDPTHDGPAHDDSVPGDPPTETLLFDLDEAQIADVTRDAGPPS